jgi:hypothetical protein
MNGWPLWMWIGAGCLGWLALGYGYAWWYIREQRYGRNVLFFGGLATVMLLLLITVSPWNPGIGEGLLFGGGVAGWFAVGSFLIGSPYMYDSKDYDHSRQLLFFRKPGGF